MKLIVDAGGTKTDWALVSPDGTVQTFESEGMNALMLSEEELRERLLRMALPPVNQTFYYGAGCVGAEVEARLCRVLGAQTCVAGDLLGAARALYGREGSGLVAILGTGSNSGVYDGRCIARNMPPLGYLLGDEGSGTAMGRGLLREVYRRGFMRAEFEAWVGMDYAQVLGRMYRRPGANAFLASLVGFIARNRQECGPIVREAFGRLFEQMGAYYGGAAAPRELRAVGGVAAGFAAELREAASAAGFELTAVMNRPMEGLIEYHKNHQ